MTRLARWLGPVLLGIGCMVAGGLTNTVMIAAIKHLAQDGGAGPDGLHPFQIGFFRCLVGFLVLLPAIRHGGGWSAVMRTQRMPLHLLRGALNAAGMLAFFLAISLAPLASVAAINFTSPLFATLLAILILGERVGLRRWTALAVGFAGTLLILRPGLGVLDPGAVYALGASLFWAAALITIKQLTDTDRPLAITAWAALTVGLFTLPAALWVWQWPSAEQWAWLAAIGALGSGVQLFLTKAFQLADTTVVLPFDFLKLVWASLFGLLLFGEVPDALTWIGGTVIFASSVYVAVRERQAAR
jgi:drug/metabolite transporter (DMT)-like permease